MKICEIWQKFDSQKCRVLLRPQKKVNFNFVFNSYLDKDFNFKIILIKQNVFMQQTTLTLLLILFHFHSFSDRSSSSRTSEQTKELEQGRHSQGERTRRPQRCRRLRRWHLHRIKEQVRRISHLARHRRSRCKSFGCSFKDS